MSNHYGASLLAVMCLTLTVISTSALSKQEGALQTTIPTYGTLTAQGTGEVSVVPDGGKLTFFVEVTNKSLSSAANQVQKRLAYITENLDNFGVSEDQWVASNVRVQRQSRWNRVTNVEEFVGFQVSREVSITIDDLENYIPLLDALIERDVDNIQPLILTTSQEDTLLEQARNKAIANAKTQAAQLAKGFDVSLKGIYNVSFGHTSPPPAPMYKGRMEMALADTNSASAPVFNPESIKISAHVTVQYYIK